ncbi:MAG: peptide ABC transporter substrate-binding protein [Candidatus Pacebacteria bacterium]|nr:peptide ABC transporter substrate-binding protein [Candidatus Paceibacterota bacterium]
MSKKERRIVFVLLFLLISSSFYLSAKYYTENTEEVPANGGEYTEALVGQTRFINPILSQTNDIDADLSSLIFSSLMRTDKNGKLENDLSESYAISEDKLTYTFHIKQGIKWHDGESLTVDDIIYTIKTIQNENYYSPLIVNWAGVRAEKVDDYTVNFILKNTYSPFLNNLTFGILPKHLWETIDSTKFPLNELNFQPIGSGPYKFESYTKDKSGKIISIKLTVYKDYYEKVPYINTLLFKLYQSEEEAISAFNRKEVKGINYISPDNTDKIVDAEGKVHILSIPRYYAVFFNQTQSKVLSDKTVRLALSYAVNKKYLVEEILDGQGSTVNSPIPQQLIGYNPETKIYEYAVEHAKNILGEAGWTDGDGDGIREKEEQKLAFTLVTTEWSDLPKTAELLQAMWKEVGADVKIKTAEDIQNDYIKTRSYEAVLFGEILSYDPDPFSFWHSSQKKEPGLNLALYDNTAVDEILEAARQETDLEIRAQKYQEFQSLVIEDVPAIFLYSPNYIYIQSNSVQGAEINNLIIPSDRFNDIENWYIRTKRVFK